MDDRRISADKVEILRSAQNDSFYNIFPLAKRGNWGFSPLGGRVRERVRGRALITNLPHAVGAAFRAGPLLELVVLPFGERIFISAAKAFEVILFCHIGSFKLKSQIVKSQ
ncbi:MAG: hypothetical protein R6U37_06370 [Dehalococcoidia bacterium]